MVTHLPSPLLLHPLIQRFKGRNFQLKSQNYEVGKGFQDHQIQPVTTLSPRAELWLLVQSLNWCLRELSVMWVGGGSGQRSFILVILLSDPVSQDLAEYYKIHPLQSCPFLLWVIPLEFPSLALQVQDFLDGKCWNQEQLGLVWLGTKTNLWISKHPKIPDFPPSSLGWFSSWLSTSVASEGHWNKFVWANSSMCQARGIPKE